MSLPDGERISDWIVDEMVALGASTTAPGSKLREHSDAIGQGVENEMLLERAWVQSQLTLVFNVIAAVQDSVTALEGTVTELEEEIEEVSEEVSTFGSRIDYLEIVTGIRPPYVGMVVPDGIVAGQVGGTWFVIAPGSMRNLYMTHDDADIYASGLGYYLPVEAQLMQIYANRTAIDLADESGVLLSDVAAAWSSEIVDDDRAWALDFSDGSYFETPRSTTKAALPVKAFSI